MSKRYEPLLLFLSVIVFSFALMTPNKGYAQGDEKPPVTLKILLGSDPDKIIIKAESPQKDLTFSWLLNYGDMKFRDRLESSGTSEAFYVLPKTEENITQTVSVIVTDSKGRKGGASIIINVSEWQKKKTCQKAGTEWEGIQSIKLDSEILSDDLKKLKKRINDLKNKNCPDIPKDIIENELKKIETAEARADDFKALSEIEKESEILKKSAEQPEGLNIQECLKKSDELESRLKPLKEKEWVKKQAENLSNIFKEIKDQLNDLKEFNGIKEELKKTASQRESAEPETLLKTLDNLESRLNLLKNKGIKADDLLKELEKIREPLRFRVKKQNLKDRIAELNKSFLKMEKDAEKSNSLTLYKKAKDGLNNLKEIEKQSDEINSPTEAEKLSEKLEMLINGTPTSSTTTSSTSSTSILLPTTSSTSLVLTTTSSSTLPEIKATTVSPEEQRIMQLSEKARKSLKAGRLMPPERDNVFDLCKEILGMDSQNSEAKSNIREIMKKYKGSGDTAFNQKKYNKAVGNYTQYRTVAEYALTVFRDKNMEKEIELVKRRLGEAKNPPTTTTTVRQTTTTSVPKPTTTLRPTTTTIRPTTTTTRVTTTTTRPTTTTTTTTRPKPTTSVDRNLEQRVKSICKRLPLAISKYEKIKNTGDKEELISAIKELIDILIETEAVYRQYPEIESAIGYSIKQLKTVRIQKEAELLRMIKK